MPAKDRNPALNCEKCGKSVVQAHNARHRKTCMMGTLYCKKRNCNFAKKKCCRIVIPYCEYWNCHTILRAKIRNTMKNCVVCQKQFPSFYSLLLTSTSSQKSTSR